MKVNISDRSTKTTLSIKEAAVLSGVTEKIVRHELAARIIRPVRKARRHVALPPSTVLYLSLVTRLPIELGRADRNDLFALLSRDLLACGRWTRARDRLVLAGGVPIIVPLTEATRIATEATRTYVRGQRRTLTDPDVLGGEPVFLGTRIAIRHVGEMARRGASYESLLEDFPALTLADIAYARLFVELGRPPGRPKRLRIERA